MPNIRINKALNSEIYFLTFTIKNWYYIFDRHNRFNILKNSIQYYQEHRGLKVYAYVFMLNHIHLMVSCPNMIGFVRDFKSFTSHEIQKNIIATEPNVLKLFQVNDKNHEFWEKTNMPKIIESIEFLEQKINYIHENPIRKEYVKNSEDWFWSSANIDSLIKISTIEV